MKTYEATVYIQNGTAKIAHTVRVNADSTFSAQQQLAGMYGANNVISVPVEVSGGGSGGSAPWMVNIG